MNRSFLIIILPAVAVGIGYVLVLRWLGYSLTPYPFVAAVLIFATAVLLVHRHQRHKSSRRQR